MSSGPYDDYDDYDDYNDYDDRDSMREREIDNNPDWFGSTDESVSEYWDHED